MPNIGGPRQSRRILISQVTNAVLLYGAQIWESRVNNSAKKDMLSLFRRSCLRVCCGYRTISGEAACVIAGVPPIDITAKEMSNVYKEVNGNASNIPKSQIRKAEREKSIQSWQSRWENSPKGRWTFKLIPHIKSWLQRKHGEVNYNLTQFLSGHGGFRSYLHRFGLDSSPRCPQCDEEDETAEHVVFKCPRFFAKRSELENFLGKRITTDNIINIMMLTQVNWDAINKFITEVNLKLHEAEVERKTLNAMLSINRNN